jgi:sortase (surface protein transpeptidase)
MQLPYPFNQLRSMHPKTLAALGASVGIVIVAALALIVGAPSSIAVQATRVVALPEAKASVTLETPPPAPARVLSEEYLASDSCPGLNNPGGHLRWVPSANAGPWTTDGSVAIPALGTQAPVVRVGVNSSGQMVVPPGAGQVAWLDQGGIPGQTNNLVIAGHISWGGVPGAFGGIGGLRGGDLVYFAINGQKMTFRISWVCSFVRSSPLAAQIMGYTNAPSITLITCGGGWDAAAGTHTNRIVARGELVSSEPA